MVKIFLVVSFIVSFSFGATLLNQNIYERDNRIDLMLSFDSVYSGRISRAVVDDAMVLTLWDAMAEVSYTTQINHPMLQKIEIPRSDTNQIAIYFYPNAEVDIIAARTGDSYGLRLRVVEKEIAVSEPVVNDRALTLTQAGQAEQAPRLAIETKENLELSTSYIVTVSVLVLIAVLLFLFKRKFANSKDSWLLPSAFSNAKKTHNLNIKYQKVLDAKNKVVLLEYEGREYLTLIGNSNILLDTYERGKVVSDDGFEKVFQQNREKLNDYLKIGHSEEEDMSNNFRKNAERVY